MSTVNKKTVTKLKILWWLLQWCSPLPIPNREVKPTCANGTAVICGRVGRRQPLQRTSSEMMRFFCLYQLHSI